MTFVRLIQLLVASTLGALLLAPGVASAASTWTTNIATQTATWTENTVSSQVTVSLSVLPGPTASPVDDQMLFSYPTTGVGCTPQGGGSKCPLGTGSVAFDTFNASLTGNVTTYAITADFDRPGLRMTSAFSLASGPNAPWGVFDGSATSVGPIATSGFSPSTGGGDDDALTGNAGANVLTGGEGSDALSGLAGNDTLIGGPGDDAISPGAGTAETADGGPGSQDTLSGAGEAGPAALSLDGVVNDRVVTGQTLTISGFENLSGGEGNDTLTGDAGFNHIYGGAGNDAIDGAGGGHDVLRGQSGDDTVQARDALALFGDVACGGGTDTAVVDAADLVDPDCEVVDRSPAPPGFVAPSFPGGPTTATGAPAGSVGAVSAAAVAAASPVITLELPKSVKRSALSKGVKVRVASTPAAAITVELVTTARTAGSPKDNLVIARSTKGSVGAQQTFTLKPSRSLARAARKVSVRVTATSPSGLVTVVKRSLKLR